MNRRMAMGGDTSLNVAAARRRRRGPVAGFPGRQRVRCRTSASPTPRKRSVRHDLLIEAMDSLNDREKHILTERRLTDEPKTLEELSQVYGVSRERIRQIEVRAFEKLQAALIRLAGERRLLPAA